VNHDDTTRLCKLIKALAPAQKIDDETPAIWQGVLADVSLPDAMDAVKLLAQTQPFIAPCDIIQRVKVARAARLVSVDTDVPDVDPDDVAAYLGAVRAARSRLAETPSRAERVATPISGAQERRALQAAPEPAHIAHEGNVAKLRAVTGTMFRRPPRVDPAREGQERPADRGPACRLVSVDEQARIDAERGRQLAALEAMTDAESAL
jgi:hypothetical protein